MWEYLKQADEYQKWFDWLRHSRYMDFPYEVSVETMSLCNARCDFCPYPTLDRKGTTLSLERIMKILNECREIPADLPFQLNFSRVNETFLDNRIYDLCHWANCELPNAGFVFFSNGTPLNEVNAHRVASLRNVIKLVISLNDYRPDVYQRVMGIPFNRTVANIETLHRLTDRGVITFPVTIHRVGDGSVHDRLFCEWVSHQYPLFAASVGPRADWIGAVNTPVSPVPEACCTQWFKINVLADAKVAFCCVDSQAASRIGEIDGQTLLEIYNQPERRRMRALVQSRSEVRECALCPLLS